MKRTNYNGLYIWQRDDWPNLRWDPQAILQPLADVSALHGALMERMASVGMNAADTLSLSAMTDELVNSSQIEGLTLDHASVRSSIGRRLGIEQYGLPPEDHYIEGLVDVMMDAVSNCMAPLTSERLFDWHSALFPTGRSGMTPIIVGGWRTGEAPMRVVSGAFGHEKVHYVAPPSERVPAEMTAFLAFCAESCLPPAILAAVAHLWFVSIHPFDDGNGRISRTVADMFLARMDAGRGRFYSVSAEINRRKKQYYDILERTQCGRSDITEWIIWFLDCLASALHRALALTERTLAKAAFWNKFRDEEINERQRKVLNRLWDGFEGNLTTSRWARMCHCSQDTALRDVRDLMARGMLVVSASGGRSTSYSIP